MLAGSLVPSALADGNPSIGWEPEVPSIDPNEPSGGEEPGGNETPDTPEPPVVGAGPGVPVEPDPPVSDPEPEIPDSGTTAPGPRLPLSQRKWLRRRRGRVLRSRVSGRLRATGRGAACGPCSLRCRHGAGLWLLRCGDGSFERLGPARRHRACGRRRRQRGGRRGCRRERRLLHCAACGYRVLSGLSIYVVDGEGNQVGDVLSGATVVQEIARQEFEAVRTATGASTVDLAERLSDAVGRVKTAEFIDEPEREGMPVLPYAIGAASAVVAVGAVGAGVALYRRHTPKDGRSSRGRLTPNLSAAGLQTTPAPVVAPDVKTGDAAAQTPGAANANDTFARMDAVFPNHPNGHADVDELDELEMLAMSLHGNPTSRTAKPRLAVDVQTPSDGDDDPNPPDGPGGGAPIDPGSTAAFLSAMGAVRPTPSASGAVGLQQRGVSDGSDGNISLPPSS